MIISERSKVDIPRKTKATTSKRKKQSEDANLAKSHRLPAKSRRREKKGKRTTTLSLQMRNEKSKKST